jgi:hypothetical protein
LTLALNIWEEGHAGCCNESQQVNKCGDTCSYTKYIVCNSKREGQSNTTTSGKRLRCHKSTNSSYYSWSTKFILAFTVKKRNIHTQ